MACMLVVAWATVFSIMIRAVVMKDILWPQKQEDREEGGWKAHQDEKRVCDTRLCDDSPTGDNGLQQMSTVASGGARGIREPDPEEGSSGSNGELPVIAERLIEESVRGRTPRKNDSMV